MEAAVPQDSSFQVSHPKLCEEFPHDFETLWSLQEGSVAVLVGGLFAHKSLG